MRTAGKVSRYALYCATDKIKRKCALFIVEYYGGIYLTNAKTIAQQPQLRVTCSTCRKPRDERRVIYIYIYIRISIARQMLSQRDICTKAARVGKTEWLNSNVLMALIGCCIYPSRLCISMFQERVRKGVKIKAIMERIYSARRLSRLNTIAIANVLINYLLSYPLDDWIRVLLSFCSFRSCL